MWGDFQPHFILFLLVNSSLVLLFHFCLAFIFLAQVSLCIFNLFCLLLWSSVLFNYCTNMTKYDLVPVLNKMQAISGMKTLMSLPGNYSVGKMNSKIYYLIEKSFEMQTTCSSRMLSDFFQVLLLLQRKCIFWYAPLPIKDMMKVGFTSTLQLRGIASRIIIAFINSAFI
jgi:hypothetical protein